jgi:zinc protease
MTAARLSPVRRLATWTLLALGLALALLGPAGAAPAQASVEIQRVSGGGVEAWLVEDHSNPIITARIAFRGGAATDPPGKEGLADMVSALLDEGAGELDSAAFQARLEDLAITLRFDADLDSLRGSLETLSENRNEAFALLRRALAEPRFDAEPVERVRSQLQARARGALEDPEVVATRAFFALAFPDHPYGRPAGGTAESLAAVGAEDLRAFVRDRLSRDRLVIGVVGDIDARELSRLLEATFAGLPQTGAEVAVADTAPATRGQVKIVATGAPQSAIVFGQRGVARDDPDYYPATVLGHVLASGPFTSRLYQEVREKRGLVYTVYARLAPLDHSALILGLAGTVNERAGETIAVIRDIWSAVAADGVSEAELADAKTYLTGSFPLRFTSSGQIAAILVSMQVEELGIDYLDRRNDLIEAVSLDDVNRLARDLLAPQALAFAIAGNPDGVEATH